MKPFNWIEANWLKFDEKKFNDWRKRDLIQEWQPFGELVQKSNNLKSMFNSIIAVSLFWFNLIRAFNSGFNCLIELNQSKKLDWINEIKASQIELSPKLNQKRQIETLILNYSLFRAGFVDGGIECLFDLVWSN